MKDEIKEILDDMKKLYDCTTNLQNIIDIDTQRISRLKKRLTNLQEENSKLKERKYYKFYKCENNSEGSDYCFCERPCDSNMSLKCFCENGEICGFMSETLVDEHPEIKEISMNEFMYYFVRPIIKENFVYKSRNEKAIEYIEERKKLNWYADGVFVYELLNILQGEDKDVKD